MNKDRQIVCVVYGRSGSGKGTQAELLKEYLESNTNRDVIFLETGSQFRKFAKTDNYTAKLVNIAISNGELLPSFLPIWNWTNSIIDKYDRHKHMILDGVCRQSDETLIFDSVMKFYNIKKPIILSIEVSEEWAGKRMEERGRADDTKESIQKRADWYNNNVTKAIQYFRDNSFYEFIEINGEQTIEEVHKEIISRLAI